MYSNSGLIIFLLLFKVCIGKRNWVYEPLSVKVHTSDPSKMDITAKLERVGREYAISATLDWQYDVDETTMVESFGFRSSSGSDDDYIALPWSMPKQTYKEYTESHYKEIVYANLRNCSNFPEPENADPWPRNQYILDKCVSSGIGMPEIAPEGYYKILFQLSGEVNWGFEFIIKVMNNRDMFGYN